MDHYYWWKGSDLLENGFLTMILKEGAENLRIDFHPQDGMLVIKDAATGEVCGTYNQSHTCPPDCP
jgi:hypothetical protein